MGQVDTRPHAHPGGGPDERSRSICPKAPGAPLGAATRGFRGRPLVPTVRVRRMRGRPLRV